MTSLTDTQVITASGGLVELGYSQITSAVSVTGTDIAVISDLTVVCDGSPVAIEFYSPRLDLAGTTLGDGCEIYLWVDGVKTGRIAERYHPNAATGPYTTAYGVRRLTPSAGSHTFKITATRQGATSPSISAGAGTTTTQSPAFLRVSKIVQATQWPAVTTGTIICTSTTRPASPFKGQTIYEGDTDLSYTYNGSSWVQTGNSTGAWTSFTPTVTGYSSLNLTNGNATIDGKYTRIGRTICFRARWVFGSTTSFNATNGYFFLGLPVTAASSLNAGLSASILDSGIAHYPVVPLIPDSSTSALAIGGIYTNGTYATFAQPTAMFTWGIGDTIYWGGVYEAAS